MGLGLLGRGVGDAKFIASCKPKKFLITDLKSKDELKTSLNELQGLDIDFRLGEHQRHDFENADTVLKAAGIPKNSQYLEVARQNDAQILMSTAIAAKYAQDLGVIVVGITGTRGKSSTTQMIYSALKNKYKSGQVFLGGNVRGVSTLELARKFKKGDVLVLELDSWQLQGFGDLKISPNIAVFTNFYPDHMNYYKDLDEYFSDKANIFKHQDLARGDILFVSDEIYELVKGHNPLVEPYEVSRIPEEWQLKVLGNHMRANAALALEVLSQMGLSMPEIKEELENFAGVEGRMEFLGEINGVKVYNDNNATSPEAAIAAIDAVLAAKGDSDRIILIAGGKDKGLPLQKLADKINESVDILILLENDGTEKLKEFLDIDFLEFESLQDATNAAFGKAKKGDVILFSPAFASFSHEFKNEYERLDAFKKIVLSQG